MSRSPEARQKTLNAARMNKSKNGANSTPHEEGHRAKRFKAERPATAIKQTIPVLKSIDPMRQDEVQVRPGARNNSFIEVNGGTGVARPDLDIEALAATVAQTPVADSTSPASAVPGHAPTLEDHSQHNLRGAKVPRLWPEKNEIDVLSAPSEPVQLAIWVAQQITHFQDEGIDLSDIQEERKPRRSSSRLPDIESQHPLTAIDLSKSSEKKRVREDNRERKQRWRRSNTEKNKDNDLRCRINKRAKTIYGSSSSNTKTAWIESEYNKRRIKRENKLRLLAFKGGRFAGFPFTPELGGTLYSYQDGLYKNEINAAGKLLADALQVANSNSVANPNAHAAVALKAALQDAKTDPSPFVEALKVMATNPETMRVINAVLDDANEDDDVDVLSGDENEDRSLQPAETHARVPTYQTPPINHHTVDAIRALNAATALLNEMADSKVYITPYANPPPRNGLQNGYTGNGSHAQKSKGSKRASSKKQAPNNYGLDQNQIDALLALANGGSLTDDEDDATIADGQEMNDGDDQESMPRADNDIIATLHRIVNQLMAERTGNRESVYSNGLPFTYGSKSVRDQAATLHKLFAQAGISINTILPAAQSHATSQLYLHLSNRARCSTPSGGINPAHASAYGNTAQMNQRILGRPGTIPQSQYPPNHPLQATISSSRGNMMGLPLRGRSAEEVQKIKSYGYPPLPGSRPGRKK